MRLQRTITENLLQALDEYPIVALFGIRQAGKTTLVQSLRLPNKEMLYLDLERESDVRRLASPELFLSQYKDSCVIIDEAQRMPSLFPLLRSLVDENRTTGRFILLGSASPLLKRGVSESLAGRIAYFDLTPFHRAELLADSSVNANEDAFSLMQLWLRGGFPSSFLAKSESGSLRWRRNFIRTYIERDLSQLILSTTGSNSAGRFSDALAMRLWRMLAHYQGSVLNASELAVSLGVSAPTVTRYIDLLDDAAIVRRIPPYLANTKKRLVKSPKIYIRDSGLLHALADIPTLHALQGHPILGQSFEGFVIEQITTFLAERGEHRFETCFYRTQNGNECDMVVLKNGEPLCSVEIKYSDAPRLTKGHALALEDLQTPHNYVIIPQGASYLAREKTRICSLDEFLLRWLPMYV